MLALVQTGVILLMLGRRYRLGLLFFVFFLAFAPRSTALALGGEGFALTFQRMSILILLGYMFVAVAYKAVLRQRLHQIVRDGPVVLLIILMILVKLLVTLVGGGLSYLAYVVDDAALSLGVFLIFASYVREPRDYYRLLAMIVASAIVSALFGMIELQIARPLVSSVLDVKVQVNEAVLLGRVRESGYRVQALFDNPLALAELAVYSLPVALFGLMVLKGGKKRLFFALGVISSLFLVYVTDARSALLAVTTVMFVYPLVYYWPRLSMMAKIVASFMLFCLVFYVLFLAFDIISSMVHESGTAEYWRYDQTERSTLSRARQYFDVAAVLRDTNYVGVGFRQNFSNEIDDINRLDNYFLRMLLEGGVLGLLLFLSVLFAAFRMIRKGMGRKGGGVSRHLSAMLISFIAGFLIMKLFVSMPGNNVYFYLMMGAYLGYVHGLRNVRPVNLPLSGIPLKRS